MIIIILLFIWLTHIPAICQESILNGGFEDTTIVVVQQSFYDTFATHWSMSDYGAGVTSDAHSGNLAVYIWNWYHYAKGMLVNGKGNVFFDGGTPISYIPSSLLGFYKYYYGENDGKDDLAFTEVLLLRYNFDSNARDTIAFGSLKLAPVNNYSPFQVEIQKLKENLKPDTILVKFYSSISSFCSLSSQGNCCYLYLDEITVSPPTNVAEKRNEDKHFEIYPNPAEDKIWIRLNEKYINKKIVVRNSLGDEILSFQTNNDKFEINTVLLIPGMYHISIYEEDELPHQKLFIKL